MLLDPRNERFFCKLFVNWSKGMGTTEKFLELMNNDPDCGRINAIHDEIDILKQELKTLKGNMMVRFKKAISEVQK